MDSEYLLSLRNIKKSFGNINVLEDISFDVTKGKLLGLIGPSGCGKSTILKVLLGIQNKDKGKIYYNGIKVKDLKKIRAKLGYCTQENAFYAKLNVEENLKFFGRLYGVPNKILNSRIDELLHLTQLPRKQFADRLSGGMKRRLDLAISLVHNPPFIILDEPTTGLDPTLRRDIWSLIRRISESGKTVIVASHMLAEIEDNCDEVIILAKGNVQSIIKPKNIKNKFPGINNLEEFFTQVIMHAK